MICYLPEKPSYNASLTITIDKRYFHYGMHEFHIVIARAYSTVEEEKKYH